MEEKLNKYIRILNLQYHFSKSKSRFQNKAFKSSKNGSGISVFDDECREDKYAHSTCAHIDKFYPNVTGVPPLFAPLSNRSVPSYVDPEYETGLTGDECHVNLKNLTPNDESEVRKQYIVPGNIRACFNDDNHIIQSKEELVKLKNEYG